MRRESARAPVARAVTVVALAILASGVPSVILAAAGAEVECSSDCEGSLGGRQCPPTCTSGACAKTVVSVVSRPVEVPMPLGEPTRVALHVPERLSGGVVRGVFHPPRA